MHCALTPAASCRSVTSRYTTTTLASKTLAADSFGIAHPRPETVADVERVIAMGTISWVSCLCDFDSLRLYFSCVGTWNVCVTGL